MRVQYPSLESSNPDSPVNKTDRHDITEILLKVALNTINETITIKYCLCKREHYAIYASMSILYSI